MEKMPQHVVPTGASTGLRDRWKTIDDKVRTWWEQDRATATAVGADTKRDNTLLSLPHPYITAGGSSTAYFAEMYGWDTNFINLGLLAHGETKQVRHHIQNQLHLIQEHGMVLNGNRTHFLTRSQPPLLADSVDRYLQAVPDDEEIRAAALDLIGREFRQYWKADHHSTPTGLTTNRDLGDPNLRAELAAEAETGLDFTAQFGGDVRRCVPLVTNCALVRTAEVLSQLAGTLGRGAEAEEWHVEAEHRSSLIRKLCWDEAEGFFLEYDWVRRARLPLRTLSAYLTMMAGIATPEQAQVLIDRLALFRRVNGVLAATSEPFPSPHPEWLALQWHDPAVWPPLQITTVEGLRRYGFHAEARSLARAFVALQVEVFEQTDQLWEKYNGRTGDQHTPIERYPSVPMHGWSAAACAHLGRIAFDEETSLPIGRAT